jgi:hypothetical protein
MKENGGGGEFNYFTYCKNLCICHSVPPPSTTIKSKKISGGWWQEEERGRIFRVKSTKMQSSGCDRDSGLPED